MQEKKFLILLILKILETESDEQHPLSQSEIVRIISGQYPCDRKTVGRNIRALMTVGYPIQKTTKGYYLAGKMFTVEEKEFILQTVRGADGKSEEDKAELADRLSGVLRKIVRKTD